MLYHILVQWELHVLCTKYKFTGSGKWILSTLPLWFHLNLKILWIQWNSRGQNLQVWLGIYLDSSIKFCKNLCILTTQLTTKTWRIHVHMYIQIFIILLRNFVRMNSCDSHWISDPGFLFQCLKCCIFLIFFFLPEWLLDCSSEFLTCALGMTVFCIYFFPFCICFVFLIPCIKYTNL